MIAVTGASGHLGQWVVARLLELGLDVLCISRRPIDRSGIEGLTWARPVRTLACDLSNGACVEPLSRALSQARGVVHLAAHIPEETARNRHADADLTLKTNVLGTIHLLLALPTRRLESVVFASTFEVYGTPVSVPIGEAHPTVPTTYYGASKAAGERYLALFGEERGTACCSLRMPAVYGPGGRLRRALENFIIAAAREEPLEIHGDGEDRRDLVYVADAADAVASALDARPRGALNLGSGRGYSVLEMAEAVRTAAGGNVSLLHRDRLKPRRDYVLEAGRAQSELGWTPRTALADGIAAQLLWARQCPA